MSGQIDVGIEALSARRNGGRSNGGVSAGGQVFAAAVPGSTFSQGKEWRDKFAAAGEQTFYLETFGCQMNVHDSEKVAGVLLARGYEPVEQAEAARLVLYNTCSIREKAAQKVFSRLGSHRGAAGAGQIIGVLG